MKTQGEIEAAICEGISRFEQEYRSRGPKQIRAYLLDDFLVVRLHGLLTPAEQPLAKIPYDKGRDLLKQIRTHLIETAKPLLQAMVEGIAGVKVVSLHHDISPDYSRSGHHSSRHPLGSGFGTLLPKTACIEA